MGFMRRICGFCDKPAVWRWMPKDPPPKGCQFRQFLCDDHAATTDLDELEDLSDAARS